jgi:hypothetical protein
MRDPQDAPESAEPLSSEVIRCDACPVLCRIRKGQSGACDRYANVEGKLTRLDPLVVLQRTDTVVPFLDGKPWRDDLSKLFITGIGATTTYPDYKPAPFIVSSKSEGVDVVTVVTEGIFSYCGLKVKIDTDRFLGPEQAAVRAQGEQIGHVTTAEYGSQMLALGGVRHLTGGSKREGNVTCESMLKLANKEPIEFTLPLAQYEAMGGHIRHVVPLEKVLGENSIRYASWPV